MQFSVRYDLRNPLQWRRPFDEYYATFLDQVAWADEHGFARVVLSEHHFVEDGYVPSILPVAAAIAARTQRIRINLSLVLLPLKHPVQVAEDAAIVDIISGGRLELTVGGGYRRNEFEGYGIPREERASRMEEGTEIIRRCWEEEAFSFHGRHWQLKNVRMTPKPVQQPRPPLIMGGNSAAAARRAARLADAFAPVQPRWMADYRKELIKLGKDPGPAPPENAPSAPMFLHVARDPDVAWRRIAPHALYEMNEYGNFAEDDPNIPYQPVTDADTLRASGAYLVQTPEETVGLGHRLKEALGPAAAMTFHPLMGGMPHQLGQESLDLVASEVMPRLRD
ncbi:MAG: LLM class flavin-dependent oxidoreductase [Dehalococcoidia bacterium]